MTININLTDSYSHATKTNGWVIETYTCQCADMEDGPWENCGVCGGDAVVKCKLLPPSEDLNIANGNWDTLASALGIDEKEGGSMSTAEFARRLYELDTDLVCRVEHSEYKDGSLRYRQAGVDREQVERYIERLRSIVFIGVARGSDVQWA